MALDGDDTMRFSTLVRLRLACIHIKKRCLLTSIINSMSFLLYLLELYFKKWYKHLSSGNASRGSDAGDLCFEGTVDGIR